MNPLLSDGTTEKDIMPQVYNPRYYRQSTLTEHQRLF